MSTCSWVFVTSTLVSFAACGALEPVLTPEPDPSETTASTLATAATAHVDHVSPREATLGALATFVVTGTNLTRSLKLEVTHCAGMKMKSGGSSTRREFTCTPYGAPGQSGGLTANYSFFVNFVSTCAGDPISLSGRFEPSGNEAVIGVPAANPIVRLEARNGAVLLTARNGEAGLITIAGATLEGTATALNGFSAFRVLDQGSALGLFTATDYEALAVNGAHLSAPQDGFAFYDPFFMNAQFAAKVEGRNNTLLVSDVFGATGVITFNCQ